MNGLASVPMGCSVDAELKSIAAICRMATAVCSAAVLASCANCAAVHTGYGRSGVPSPPASGVSLACAAHPSQVAASNSVEWSDGNAPAAASQVCVKSHADSGACVLSCSWEAATLFASASVGHAADAAMQLAALDAKSLVKVP